jgi:hypothetical protein
LLEYIVEYIKVKDLFWWEEFMRVGIDIDGVLADSLSLWVRELNIYFNKNVRVEDFHLYDIRKTYDLAVDEIDSFIELKGKDLMTRSLPFPGASYYLDKIKKHHDIYIITARNGCYRDDTERWLKKHGFSYDRLYLLGSHEKQEICVEKKLHVMVEDTLEIGEKISSAGIPVLLMDAPYNRGSLPDLIYRKRSWEEIYGVIMKSGRIMFSEQGLLLDTV